MDDLPELPFEKVLSYLNLGDRLRLSAVSRSCRQKIANHRVKSLCYSERPSGFIWGKSRWVSGAFAENFISSTRFATFFDTFGQSVLSGLKHLHLCGLDSSVKDQSTFIRTLNSFGQLEELNIIRVNCGQQQEFKLNLPKLTSIRLEQLKADRRLTLEAPRLRKVTVLDCPDLRLHFVHAESVESLNTESVKSLNTCRIDQVKVKNLKNLQCLYVKYLRMVDSTFLSSLKQLKEIHLQSHQSVSQLFEQKRRYGCADLKIYVNGLLLDDPDDPARGNAINGYLTENWLVCLAENRSRLADEIPLYHELRYSEIDGVAPRLEVNVLKRCTELKEVTVDGPLQDTQRFLDLLKNWKNISELSFECDQPQDLFDRLPEHCAVQKLYVYRAQSDLTFLFRLKNLIHLNIFWPIDSETVRRAFEELPFLSYFTFSKVRSSGYSIQPVAIEIDRSKRFSVSVDFKKIVVVSDLNAAIELLFGKEQKKRKADELDQ